MLISTSLSGSARQTFETLIADSSAARPAAPYRTPSGTITQSRHSADDHNIPRSRRICRNARKMIAPNARLKAMTIGRGNSAAKTNPEDRRLQRWYCDATSRRIASQPLL